MSCWNCTKWLVLCCCFFHLKIHTWNSCSPLKWIVMYYSRTIFRAKVCAKGRAFVELNLWAKFPQKAFRGPEGPREDRRGSERSEGIREGWRGAQWGGEDTASHTRKNCLCQIAIILLSTLDSHVTWLRTKGQPLTTYFDKDSEAWLGDEQLLSSFLFLLVILAERRWMRGRNEYVRSLMPTTF